MFLEKCSMREFKTAHLYWTENNAYLKQYLFHLVVNTCSLIKLIRRWHGDTNWWRSVYFLLNSNKTITSQFKNVIGNYYHIDSLHRLIVDEFVFINIPEIFFFKKYMYFCFCMSNIERPLNIIGLRILSVIFCANQWLSCHEEQFW